MRETMTYTQAAAILKVDPSNITKEELKTTYIALARENHQDYNKKPDANKVMGQINEAYATLKNEVPIRGYKPERKYNESTFGRKTTPFPEQSTSEDLQEFLRQMFAQKFAGFDFGSMPGFDSTFFDFTDKNKQKEPNIKLFKGVDPKTGKDQMYATAEEAELSNVKWYTQNVTQHMFAGVDPQTGRPHYFSTWIEAENSKQEYATRKVNIDFDNPWSKIPKTFEGVDPSTGKARKYKTAQEAINSQEEWLRIRYKNQNTNNNPPPKQDQQGKWKRSAKGNLYRIAPHKPSLHRWIIIPSKKSANSYDVLEIIEGDTLNITVNHDKTFSTEEAAIIYVDDTIHRIHQL